MADTRLGNVIGELLASFTQAERASLLREVDRRLHPLIGKKISARMEAEVVRIIVEELEMILVARHA
jgi:hypothetical protein